MYKKVYLEVTNNCNLNCSFCIKNDRIKKFIDIEKYKLILDKLKPFTKYLYFHVSGEPLLHPQINDLINYACNDFFINITTNGYLIKRIKDNLNIRQVNISLHSFNESYYKPLNEYMEDIFEVIDNLNSNTYFSLRFWTNNKYNSEILKIISAKYNVDVKLESGFKITNNVYISINKEFIWPSLINEYYNENGTCYALKDHIGILVNGDVVPCCLDANGVIKLGNILTDSLDNIINSDKYINMKKGFQNNIKCEELCKKCNFLE